MTPSKSSHLPLLYNVYLNCIFNNPQYHKSPFKQTIQELADSHNEYTILVPPASILEEAYDPASATASNKVFLKDLCYSSEDFIRSHIIRSSMPSFNSNNSPRNQLIVYHTLNGKQILLKNGVIFTGKGFKRSLKLNVLGFGQFCSFCDYFPKGSKFMLIYIEDTLIGSNFLCMTEYIHPKFLSSSTITSNNKLDAENTSTNTKKSNDTITFEVMLRSFPVLSKAVSEKYYKLFHHNNMNHQSLQTQTRKKLSFIREEFNRIIEEAYTIVLESIKADNPDSEKAYYLIKNVLESQPEIDLNRLVYEYVELNMYDKLWSQLIFQFNFPNDDKLEYDPDALKILTHDKYNKLSCLSLNQLDIPIKEPWNMNTVLRRISLAILEFTKLSDSSVMNLSAKRSIIFNTVNILTNSTARNSDSTFDMNEKSSSIQQDPELVIDADTLVGMLIMVIVHSKIDNLEAHLYYLKNFNSKDFANDGFFNYIISNIDAVIYHLSATDEESNSFRDLEQSSQANYEFWAAIQKQNLDKVQVILDNLNETYGDSDIPDRCFLKSRNIHGESCLMFAVKTGNVELFNILVDSNPLWFSIDEILFDRNTTNGQNLLTTSLLQETPEISAKLLEILNASAEPSELVSYVNLVDITGRSCGHYVFHDLNVLCRIGHLINWESRDNNYHTPLFSICRCYDHNDYVNLIKKAFDCVYQKAEEDKGIDFDQHKDKNGNTLLHVILKGIRESRILSRGLNSINVNQLNNKSMSPLTLYVKYSRVSNLEELLKDVRLEFLAEEPKNLYNVFDYLSFLASKPTAQSKDFKVIEYKIFEYAFSNYLPNNGTAQIIATNARFDTTAKDWIIFFRVKNSKGEERTILENLEKLKQMIHLIQIKFPFIAFPSKDSIWINYRSDKQTVPAYSKFKINRVIEAINLYLSALSIYSREYQEVFYQGFNANDKNQTLTFEVLKEANKYQEHAKKRLGDVKLSDNQITEIETFLRYSQNDLDVCNRAMSRLSKLLSVYDVKQKDLKMVYVRLLAKIGSSELIPNLLETMKLEYHGDEIPDGFVYTKLQEYVIWLELSMTGLTGNIGKLLNKLELWKEIYNRIRGINNELKRYEHKVDAHTHEEGGSHIESQIISNSTNNTNEGNGTTNSSSSFFSFGLENKKSRYKRLLLVKADEVKKIMNLNAEIKLEHEDIASEISRFLKFKSNFLCFGIKQFTLRNLTSLRNSHYQLSQVFRS